MTQELIPALIRADTGNQLFTFPSLSIRELFLDGSVIEPIKYGIVYLMTVRALPSHNSITLPHIEQSPTLRYSTFIPSLTAEENRELKAQMEATQKDLAIVKKVLESYNFMSDLSQMLNST